MSEPYDGDVCPFCGSASTLTWSRITARAIGYGTECLSCGTRWNFPAASDSTELSPVTWTVASAAYASGHPGWQAGDEIP